MVFDNFLILLIKGNIFLLLLVCVFVFFRNSPFISRRSSLILFTYYFVSIVLVKVIISDPSKITDLVDFLIVIVLFCILTCSAVFDYNKAKGDYICYGIDQNRFITNLRTIFTDNLILFKEEPSEVIIMQFPEIIYSYQSNFLSIWTLVKLENKKIIENKFNVLPFLNMVVDGKTVNWQLRLYLLAIIFITIILIIF
jgi:Ca2+/Na+ antiporter